MFFFCLKKIIERYSRNEDIKAFENISELIYRFKPDSNIEADKFQIAYHRESSKIAPSTREFTKPHNWTDRGTTVAWNPDFHQTYKV